MGHKKSVANVRVEEDYIVVNKYKSSLVSAPHFISIKLHRRKMLVRQRRPRGATINKASRIKINTSVGWLGNGKGEIQLTERIMCDDNGQNFPNQSSVNEELELFGHKAGGVLNKSRTYVTNTRVLFDLYLVTWLVSQKQL